MKQACITAIHRSAEDYDAAARSLNLEKSVVLDEYDQPFCRMVRTIVSDNHTRAAFFPVLKSGHTEALARLDKAKIARWDTPADQLMQSCVEAPNRNPQALDSIANNVSARFVLVREPLSHFLRGFAEVENYFKRNHNRADLVRERSQWNGSAWHECNMGRSKNCRPAERMKGMLHDLHAGIGSRRFRVIAAHMLPQTVGLLTPRGVFDFSMVLRLEKMDASWKAMLAWLGVMENTQAFSSLNNHSHIKTTDGRWHPPKLRESVVLWDTALVRTLCFMLRREFACLGYNASMCEQRATDDSSAAKQLET